MDRLANLSPRSWKVAAAAGLLIATAVLFAAVHQPAKLSGGLEPLVARAPVEPGCRLQTGAHRKTASGDVVRLASLIYCERNSSEPVLMLGARPYELWPAATRPKKLGNHRLLRSVDGSHWLAYVDADASAHLLLRSDDGGKTFFKVNAPGWTSLASDASRGALSYSGDGFENLCVSDETPRTFGERLGLAWNYSDDSGGTWTGAVLDVLTGRDAPGTSARSNVSRDGGRTWSRSNGACPKGQQVVLARDPAPPDVEPPSEVAEPAPRGPELKPTPFEWQQAKWDFELENGWVVDRTGHGHSVEAANGITSDRFGPLFDGTAALAVPDAPGFAAGLPFNININLSHPPMAPSEPLEADAHLLTRGDPDGDFAWDVTLTKAGRLRFTVRDANDRRSALEAPADLGADYYAVFDPPTGRQWLIQLGRCEPVAFATTDVRPAGKVADAQVHLLKNFRGRLRQVAFDRGLMLPAGPGPDGTCGAGSFLE